MGSHRRRLRILVLAAGLAAGSCGNPASARGPGNAPDFVIGGIPLDLASGAALAASGGLTLYVSDQVDTCLAVLQVPVMRTTLLELRVAPAADGTTAATVVPPKPAPAAGEAVGGITVRTGGTLNASLDAASGSVAWTANADGSVTVTSLDVGFAGTADRLTTAGLHLRACP
ncbi:MAG TPA: hypothetical protein VLD85_14430 [Anaeromyxobacteraceae bacterium]|nr:hypothetical protein [Anaeromyxobacteraceae bacterium]